MSLCSPPFPTRDPSPKSPAQDTGANPEDWTKKSIHILGTRAVPLPSPGWYNSHISQRLGSDTLTLPLSSEWPSGSSLYSHSLACFWALSLLCQKKVQTYQRLGPQPWYHWQMAVTLRSGVQWRSEVIGGVALKRLWGFTSFHFLSWHPGQEVRGFALRTLCLMYPLWNQKQ